MIIFINITFNEVFGKKKTNKLSESKEKLEDDSTYDDTNNDHYDDTNLDLTYDDTLQPCDETYEGFDAEPGYISTYIYYRIFGNLTVVKCKLMI